MTVVNGLFISSDENVPITRIKYERDDTSNLQALIGGLFDVVDIQDPPVSLWLDDNGKAVGKKMNSRATTLLWCFCKPYVARDYLAGDIVVTGHPDGDGNTQDVPQELVHLLLEASLFSVQVQTDGSDVWTGPSMVFADFWSAAGFSIDLGIRWENVTATRVVPKQL